ncbi:MAG: CinA family protein [Pelagibacteraceae bacterium]|nr:CinA family protein [Pelagibacteraceae bacterium]
MKKLSQKIVKLLKRKRLKLSVVESCTGGMLSSALTSVSGSSKIFTLGLVAYSNQSKNRVLKVPKQIIRKHGAVSMQCCLSMLNNLSKISKSNIAVSITGIAGPSGGSKQKPVGLVYVGIKKGNKIKIHKCLFKNKGRSYIQKATVRKSLGLILNILK